MSKSQVFLLPGPQYPLLQQSASPRKKKGGKRSIETKSRELVKAEAAIPVLPPHIVCLNDGEINFFSPNPIQIPSIERREEARSLHPNPSMKKGPCLEWLFPVTPVDPRLGSGLGIAEWAHFFLTRSPLFPSRATAFGQPQHVHVGVTSSKINNTRKRQRYGLRCGDGWLGWWNSGRSAKKNTHRNTYRLSASVPREEELWTLHAP